MQSFWLPVKWYYKFSYNPLIHLQLLSRNFLPMEIKAPWRKNIGPLQLLHACRLDVTAWDPSSLLIIFTNSYICESISLGYHSTRSTPQSFTYLWNYVKGVARAVSVGLWLFAIQFMPLIIVITLKNHSKKFKAKTFIPSSVCGIDFLICYCFQNSQKIQGIEHRSYSEGLYRTWRPTKTEI